MRTFAAVFQTMRPPFLLLVMSCLVQSLGMLTYLNIDWSWLLFSLVFVCGLSAHIAVNMLNEYHDCASQLDFNTSKTPFSGGSGALVLNPGALSAVKTVGWLFVFSTILSGLLILNMTKAQPANLVLMGIVGVAIIIAYTPVLNRYAWLCLIAPGVGFGVLMSYGSFVVLSGSHLWIAFILALVPSLLTNNLLLLNQFPDAQADAEHGRNHIVIKRGYRMAASVYFVQWQLAVLALVIGLWWLSVPWYVFLAGLPLVFGLRIYALSKDYTATTPAFLAGMGQNVLMTLLTPVLLGVLLCVAG
ncbi:prenyltransferase [Alteromonas sp. AMM-1]|uniref:prenyltransferase n=1 Tax=Alteromonas sp. AMM-1 TaxID=3394233 RepID=UPI0039A64297